MTDPAPIVGYWTDRGSGHPENEDLAGAGRCRTGFVLVVADGLGSRDKSSMAARVAVNTVGSVIDEGGQASASLLRRALVTAHVNIQQLSARDGSRRLGAACAVAVVDQSRVWFANTGDVRVYRVMQTGGLVRLSHDQTLLQQRLDRNELDWSESHGHPDGRVLSGFLGQRGELVALVEDSPVPLRPGDRVVLCTDGVSSVLKDSEIGQIVTDLPPDEAARTLVERAREKGSRDDATAVVALTGVGGAAAELFCEPFGALTLPPPPEPSVLDRSVVVQAVRRRDRTALVVAGAVALLIAAVALKLHQVSTESDHHIEGTRPPATVTGVEGLPSPGEEDGGDRAPSAKDTVTAVPRPESVSEALTIGGPHRQELLDILQGAHRRELLAQGTLPPLAADASLPPPLPHILDAARSDDDRALILGGTMLELVLDRDAEGLRRLDAEMTARMNRPDLTRMMVHFVEIQTEPLFQRWALEQLKR